jgi:hypothetical protein
MQTHCQRHRGISHKGGVQTDELIVDILKDIEREVQLAKESF